MAASVKLADRLIRASELLYAYAEEEMTLDQLMAFTVNSDRARQEQVSEALQRRYSGNNFPRLRTAVEQAERLLTGFAAALLGTPPQDIHDAVDCAADLRQRAVVVMRYKPLIVGEFRDQVARTCQPCLRIPDERRQDHAAGSH